MKRRLSYLLLVLSCVGIFSSEIYANEDPPANIDYWKQIIEGRSSLERPERQDWNLANKVRTFNEYDGKQILSLIREGDYTHAGEEEAIDLIMASFFNNPEQQILDVACVLGGTAHYIQSRGWGHVTGFDIEEEAIQYAQQTYPDSRFFVSDVGSVSSVIASPDYDLILIVNSFVCFPDQLQCLKELRKLAKPSTKLVIFDYTDLANGKNNPLTGASQNVSFLPINPKKINHLCSLGGWKINQYKSLDSSFVRWYERFIEWIDAKQSEIDAHFGKHATQFVKGKYNLIYHGLKNGWLGGCILTLSPLDLNTGSNLENTH